MTATPGRPSVHLDRSMTGRELKEWLESLPEASLELPVCFSIYPEIVRGPKMLVLGPAMGWTA